MKALTLLIAGAALCLAGETRSWTQSDYSDFQKGNLKNLSIRSDGRLSLAPRTTEIYDSSTAYLWALARDSHGNLYTAGGPGAKLFRIPPNGKGEKIAEFDALEIHAIAVDSKDRVYAATAPDGKIYRVAPNGKTEEFYDPKQKYIWSMLCDPAGNLYVATGEQGEVHKVAPDGKGAVFFKTDETHARSIALDHQGNLIVGTEPGGLVIRVSPKGEGFVLYQDVQARSDSAGRGSEKRDLRGGAGQQGGESRSQFTASSRRCPARRTASGRTGGCSCDAGYNPRGLGCLSAVNFAGSGEVVDWRAGSGIRARARCERSLADRFRQQGQSLPRGDPIALLDAGKLPGRAGHCTAGEQRRRQVYAVTGNVGQVFRVGPGIEPEGTIESDVFDTGGFSTWGRLTAAGDLRGGKIVLSARSGNLDRPQQNWSPWSTPVVGPEGGQIAAPSARFVQWKATLNAGAITTAFQSLIPWKCLSAAEM